MISLATFALFAAPFCVEATDVQKCVAWVANEMVLDQAVNPGYDVDFYLENAIERMPEGL
jgi:hypothetical protein